MEINRETIQRCNGCRQDLCAEKNISNSLKKSVTNVYKGNTWENQPRICNGCRQVHRAETLLKKSDTSSPIYFHCICSLHFLKDVSVSFCF